MSSIPETGTSYSIASTPETEYPALAGEIEVDVCAANQGAIDEVERFVDEHGTELPFPVAGAVIVENQAQLQIRKHLLPLLANPPA